jgi:threonine/homoserine/homoserine lactone efflux protein
MLNFLIIGIILGLSPGPLLALVISETLQHNIRSGIKIAVAIPAGRSRSFLTGNSYRAMIRCLGLFLIILAGKLFYDGLKLLQIFS